MTDAAAKNVLSAILDNWSRGMSITGLFTDAGAAAAPGDTLEIPFFNAFTVNRSESASVASSTPQIRTLQIDTDHFVNQGITNRQYELILNRGGNFLTQVGRRAAGDFVNDTDRSYIDKMFENTTAADHVNLDLSATLGDSNVADVIAKMKGQDGVTSNADLAWVGSPRATAQIKGFANYAPFQPAQGLTPPGVFGLPQVLTLDGIPYFEHGGMPGDVDATRLQAVTTAVTVASNVATATVEAGEAEKFTVGQLIWTSGLTTNVPVGTPTAITAISGNDITFALTAGDGALADGVGVIYSASSMLALVKRDWCWYGDVGAPRVAIVERETNAGYSMKMVGHTGFRAYFGAIKVLHLDDA